eukprot:7834750-Pyramimonas_sp.AAC.1
MDQGGSRASLPKRQNIQQVEIAASLFGRPECALALVNSFVWIRLKNWSCNARRIQAIRSTNAEHSRGAQISAWYRHHTYDVKLDSGDRGFSRGPRPVCSSSCHLL